MGNGSSAYAELGGGIGSAALLQPRRRSGRASITVDAPAHRHSFDPVSGWCGCGRRDDGRTVGRAESVR